jgi:hypothetical protein
MRQLMSKSNLRKRFDRISDEVGIDEDEANELITAAGIDVDAAYTRLIKRIKKEEGLVKKKQLHGLIIIAEEGDLIGNCALDKCNILSLVAPNSSI